MKAMEFKLRVAIIALLVHSEDSKVRSDALVPLCDYLDALEKKLELSHDHDYDAVDCRDETIKMLENQVEALRSQVEKLNSNGYHGKPTTADGV